MIYTFWDFDSTLVKHNYPFDAGQEEDEYMDSPASLEMDFELKEEIYKEYKNAEGTKRILLTNRSIKVKDEVINLLEELGVTFDDHLFRDKDRSKGNRLNDYLQENKTPKEIHFWDDKDKHIMDMFRVSKIYKDITFHLNKVD